MTAPVVTIKVRAGHILMERIQKVSRYLDITPGNFIEHAIEAELSRQEAHLQAEGTTLDTLRRDVLGRGQTVTIHGEAEPSGEATCQLCLKPIPAVPGVEGPLLCEDCLALAKRGKAPGVPAP